MPHDRDETEVEAGGRVKGAATAIVTQNRDPEGYGRVRLRFPWLPDAESHWAPVAAPMAGKDRGAVFYPEVGDEVLVLFERGDMRFPYVVGALWSGKDTPPETNSDGANDVRIVKTRKGHHLRFNDGAQGEIDIQLDSGKRITIDDAGIRLDDGAGNTVKLDSRSGAVSVEAATSLKISAPNVSIEATGSLTLKASGQVVIQGATIALN